MTEALPPPLCIPPPTHSDIFEKFVDPDADDDRINVAGMVAYGLYKKDKRQWMIRFHAAYARAPTAVEISNYTIGWNEARIDASRNMAKGVLKDFAAFVLTEERPRIVKEALRGTFLSNLLMGLLVNALYTAILVLIVVGLSAQGVDLLDVFENLKPQQASVQPLIPPKEAMAPLSPHP